jgi:release factor glutamine methyltransferase
VEDYTPTVSDEEARWMRTWHEEHHALLRDQDAGPRVFDYLGLELVIPPHVQIIESTSDLLGSAVLKEVRAEDKVLDMGTGSGVNAILAATVASDVEAVDINPIAVEAARANAERNGVGDRVRVHVSDVFSEVQGRYDLVIFDPPFRWFPAGDWAEAAITDENYRALTTFFAEVRDHLTEDGRILMFFGSTADLGYLETLIDRHGFDASVLDRRAMMKDGFAVEYLSYRLVP